MFLRECRTTEKEITIHVHSKVLLKMSPNRLFLELLLIGFNIS